MKLAFALYGRRPLGRLLDRIVACFDRWPAGDIRLALTSRQGRDDLPRETVLKSAASTSSDFCWLRGASVDVVVDWNYGPGDSVPKVAGSLECPAEQLSSCRGLLNDVCLTIGATYGFCDLEGQVDSGTSLDPRNRASYEPTRHFPALYWYNYFGPEYQDNLELTDSLRRLLPDVETLSNGALLVITRPKPNQAADERTLTAITQAWPFFKDRVEKPVFPRPVNIDYSAVRDLAPAQRSRPVLLRSLVGNVDEFIASVPAHAARFHDWLREKGRSVTNETEYFRTLREFEGIVRDELLLPAVAAYGELIRARSGGEWRKAMIFHRGEPVVAPRGRPWAARRVVLEVLQGLELDSPEQP